MSGREDPEVEFYGDDCPFARAIRRAVPEAAGVLVSRDFTIIVYPGNPVAERYENPERMRLALIEWERTGEFEAGITYELVGLPSVVFGAEK